MMMAGSRAQTKLKRMIINFHHRKTEDERHEKSYVSNNKKNDSQTIAKSSQKRRFYTENKFCAYDLAPRNKKLISNKDFFSFQIDNLHSLLLLCS
jgi:hypothetical protein